MIARSGVSLPFALPLALAVSVSMVGFSVAASAQTTVSVRSAPRAPTAPKTIPAAIDVATPPTSMLLPMAEANSPQSGKVPEFETGLLPVALIVGVAPYGDVFIDGEPVAKNAKRVRVFVHPGPHRVEVRNPYAAVNTQAINVPDSDDATELRVRLTPKPAQLFLASNTNVTVSVGNKVLGTRSPTDRRPIAVPLSAWAGTSLVQVALVSAQGQRRVLELSVSAGTVIRRRVDFGVPNNVRAVTNEDLGPMAW